MATIKIAPDIDNDKQLPGSTATATIKKEENAEPQDEQHMMDEQTGYQPVTIDADYLFHLREVERLQILRRQMEPELRRVRNKLPKMEKTRSFEVTHIDNPHDFYVKFADVELPVQLLDHRMQRYYDNPRNLVKVKYDPVFDVRIYLYEYELPGGKTRWERVKVCALNKQEKYCRIFLIDVGVKDTAYYDELYELSEEFSASEARAIRVYLLDLIPENGANQFPEDAINAFKELALNKKFDGVGRNQFNSTEDSEFMEHCTRYGVILYDKQSPYTLNGEFCRLGFAEPIGFAAGRYDLLEDDERTDDHDNRTCDFNISKLADILNDREVANEFEIPVEDPGEIEKEFMQYCRDMNRTGLLKKMPIDIKERAARCLCSTLLNPTAFYVQLYDKIPLYEQMMTYMDSIKAKVHPVLDQDQIHAGTLLLVLCNDDTNRTIHRAVAREAPKGMNLRLGSNILFANPQPQSPKTNYFVKVFLFDIGRTMSAKLSQLRLLPKNLCNIPPFCYRVHLDLKNARPATSTWPSSASNIVRRYCVRPIPDGTFYIWRTTNSSVLPVDDVDTDLEFNVAERKWSSKSLRKFGPSERADVETLKANPFFRQFFTSIGIELSFELSEGPTQKYLSLKQDNMAVILKEGGHAVSMDA